MTPARIARATPRRLAALFLALGASCSMFDRGTPCGPEFRTTAAGGDVADSLDTRLGSASVTLSETRDGSRPAALTLAIVGLSDVTGGPLQGHVVKVHLLARDSTVLLAPTVTPVPAGSGGGALIRSVSVDLGDASAVSAMRTHILSKNLLLTLETDERPARHFTVPLVAVQQSDWLRTSCL